MFKVVCIAAVVGVVASLPRPDGGTPIYGPPTPASHPVHAIPHDPAPYKGPPQPYAFDYGVKDDYTGANFGHSENSNGEAVKGSYTVALPDGRIQTVNYIADHEHGFVAEVSYEGQAVYPDHQPAYHAAPPPPVYA